MYPIDVPHLAKICTSHVPHSGPDEMAALAHHNQSWQKSAQMFLGPTAGFRKTMFFSGVFHYSRFRDIFIQ